MVTAERGICTTRLLCESLLGFQCARASIWVPHLFMHKYDRFRLFSSGGNSESYSGIVV